MSTSPTKERIIRLLMAADLTIYEIADTLAIPRNTVARYIPDLCAQKHAHIDRYERQITSGITSVVAIYKHGPRPKGKPEPDRKNRASMPVRDTSKASRARVIVRRDPLVAAFFGEA